MLDDKHGDAALEFIERAYDNLQEKPTGTPANGCRRIADAAARAGVALQICHLLRHTNNTRTLKRELAGGVIDNIVVSST